MDIRCVVCGEPYDAWGVNHGDMSFWEANLFRQGAGCPSCCGEAPNGKQFEMTSILDCDNGDEDPSERLNASEDYAAGKAPKWERPTPEVIWQCDGCGVQVVRDIDASPNGPIGYDKAPLEWGWDPKHHRGSYRTYLQLRNYEAEDAPAHVFTNGSKVCSECLETCDDCDAKLCSNLEHGDTYSEGNVFFHSNDVLCRKPLCIDCFEKYCFECEEDPCECLANVLREVCRPHDFEEYPDEERVYEWLNEHRKGTHGEEVKAEEVEEALLALGYLELVEEEKGETT